MGTPQVVFLFGVVRKPVFSLKQSSGAVQIYKIWMSRHTFTWLSLKMMMSHATLLELSDFLWNYLTSSFDTIENSGFVLTRNKKHSQKKALPLKRQLLNEKKTICAGLALAMCFRQKQVTISHSMLLYFKDPRWPVQVANLYGSALKHKY